jgi:hypothetical protein
MVAPNYTPRHCVPLALASAVILRSESLGTHEHILLPQIRVRDTLQLEVYRQSVSLGAKPLETHGQNF